MPTVTVKNLPSHEAAVAFANGLAFVNDSAIKILRVNGTTVIFEDGGQDYNLTIDYETGHQTGQ
jgi:hypothetical protein